jgi:hypothetical protein
MFNYGFVGEIFLVRHVLKNRIICITTFKYFRYRHK